jgi:hypothetical protein
MTSERWRNDTLAAGAGDIVERELRATAMTRTCLDAVMVM